MKRMSVFVTLIIILMTVAATKEAVVASASVPVNAGAGAVKEAAGEAGGREHGAEGAAEKEAEGAGEAEHGEGGEGEHGAEAWWRFTGWESVFTILAGLYFGLAIQILPRFLAEPSTEKEHH